MVPSALGDTASRSLWQANRGMCVREANMAPCGEPGVGAGSSICLLLHLLEESQDHLNLRQSFTLFCLIWSSVDGLQARCGRCGREVHVKCCILSMACAVGRCMSSAAASSWPVRSGGGCQVLQPLRGPCGRHVDVKCCSLSSTVVGLPKNCMLPYARIYIP
jgi:hypothetical protein